MGNMVDMLSPQGMKMDPAQSPRPPYPMQSQSPSVSAPQSAPNGLSGPIPGQGGPGGPMGGFPGQMPQGWPQVSFAWQLCSLGPGNKEFLNFSETNFLAKIV